MDLAEAMRTQRSIRRLKPDPVDDELLPRCLELATRAPSGGNRQPAEFILVRDRRVKAALGRLYRQSWSVYGGLGKLLYGGHERARKIMDAVDWQVEHWEEVPVVVVAYGPTTRRPVERSVHVDRYGNRPFLADG
jgi:nitroreductase